MSDMDENEMRSETERDPLGLSRLPMQTDAQDGWPSIAQALDDGSRVIRQRWSGAAGWLAAAACLALVAGFSTRLDDWRSVVPKPESAQVAQLGEVAPSTDSEALAPLIAMSQNLESQLRALRDGNGAMPSESALFVAELEDLVAQVDNQISFSPRSLDLWGQRVNLLLDLAQIYQQQWEREYGRMASL